MEATMHPPPRRHRDFEDDEMTFQTYDEVCRSTDFFELLKHCKEAVIENNEQNGADFSDWDGGSHIIDVFLEHNTWIHESPDDKDNMVKALNDWLAKQ